MHSRLRARLRATGVPVGLPPLCCEERALLSRRDERGRVFLAKNVCQRAATGWESLFFPRFRQRTFSRARLARFLSVEEENTHFFFFFFFFFFSRTKKRRVLDVRVSLQNLKAKCEKCSVCV